MILYGFLFFLAKGDKMMLVTILKFWWQICHQYFADFCLPQEIMLHVEQFVFEIFQDQLDCHLDFCLLDIFSKLKSNQFDVFHPRNNRLDDVMIFFVLFLNFGCRTEKCFQIKSYVSS